MSDQEPQIDTDLLYLALGWCGCSDGNVTVEFEKRIKKLMDAANAEESHYSSDPIDQIIFLELDRIGFLGHGTSIRGSWIEADDNPGPWSFERVNKWLENYCKEKGLLEEEI